MIGGIATPVTPFHFGPGLLFKAAMPRRFSFMAFAVTQVVIDLETLYHLIEQDWPVHRLLHTYIGAVIVGTGVGLAGFLVARSLAPFVREGPCTDVLRYARRTWKYHLIATLAGGLIGGTSHVLLDSIMHVDVQPLWPLATDNGLLHAVSVGRLHLGCVVAGLVGAGILLVNRLPRIAD